MTGDPGGTLEHIWPLFIYLSSYLGMHPPKSAPHAPWDRVQGPSAWEVKRVMSPSGKGFLTLSSVDSSKEDGETESQWKQ